MAMGDHQFFQTFKHSFSLADIHPDFQIINSSSPLFQNQNQNQNDQDSSSSAFNFHNSILPQNLENLFLNAALTPPIISSKERERERKRKANDHTDQTTCANTSSDHSGSPSTTNRGGRGKKAAKGDNEKPREVIHVRARRGQATDSHSLAERVRRGKINERLRCLQDIVPGCYKSMGMAVMLDEIINYVQSLQNQVDFLSMRLTEASSFYDFNTETDALEAMLQHLKQ